MSSRKTLEEFDGCCMDLSTEVANWLDKLDVKFFDLIWLESEEKDGALLPSTIPDMEWRYHVVIEDTAGRIHDAWFKKVLTKEQYLQEMFPKQRVRFETFAEINNEDYQNPNGRG